MDVGEWCFKVQIAVCSFVLGAHPDVVQGVGVVCHLHAQYGRLQMRQVELGFILLLRDGVLARHLQVDIRVGDGCESVDEPLVVAAVQPDVAESVVVEVEQRNFALCHKMFLGALCGDVCGDDAQLGVVEYLAQVDALGIHLGVELLAVLVGVYLHVSCVGAQYALGSHLALAFSADYTFIIYVAQSEHLFWNLHFAAQVGGYLLHALVRNMQGLYVGEPVQLSVPVACLGVRLEQDASALGLEVELVDACRCTGAREVGVDVESIVPFSEDRSEASHIRQGDERWLDAALKLQRFADELSLLVCAVGGDEVFQQQLALREFQLEVAQARLMLVCIHLESQILYLKS